MTSAVSRNSRDCIVGCCCSCCTGCRRWRVVSHLVQFGAPAVGRDPELLLRWCGRMYWEVVGSEEAEADSTMLFVRSSGNSDVRSRG